MVSGVRKGTRFLTSFSPWLQRAASKLPSPSLFPGWPSCFSELAAEQKNVDPPPQASPLFSWAEVLGQLGAFHVRAHGVSLYSNSVNLRILGLIDQQRFKTVLRTSFLL